MSNEFSYERYLAGEKVVTRSGEEVVFLSRCKGGCQCHRHIKCVTMDRFGCLMFHSVYEDGKADIENSSMDLVMASKTMDLYIAVQKFTDPYLTHIGSTNCYRSFERAYQVVEEHKDLYFILKITVNTDTWEQVL